MEGIVFRIAQRADYEVISSWIVEVCHVPEQHCLHSWSGESAPEVCQQLLTYLDDGELCYLMALQNGKLVGSMGSEYDEELGRAWLHGPHVLPEQWETLASNLFSRVLQALPDSVTSFSAYLNVNNTRARQFYVQHGFKENCSLSYEYWLQPADRVPLRESPCLMIAEPYAVSFLRLFQTIFPTAYYSGERLLKMIGSSHQGFVVLEQDEVVGFVFVYVDKSSSKGEIQFLGVRADQRGKGYGKHLLLTAIDWLLDTAKVSQVTLNVSDDAANARRLYESVGFALQYTGIGLRKTLKTS